MWHHSENDHKNLSLVGGHFQKERDDGYAISSCR